MYLESSNISWFRLITSFLIYTQIFLIISHIDIKKLSFTFIQTLSLSLQCCILCELSSKRNSRLPKSFSFITRREKKEKEKDQQSYQIRAFVLLIIISRRDGDIRLRNDPVTGDDPNFWTLVRDSVVAKWGVEPCNLDRSEIKWAEPSVLDPAGLSTRPNPIPRPTAGRPIIYLFSLSYRAVQCSRESATPCRGY